MCLESVVAKVGRKSEEEDASGKLQKQLGKTKTKQRKMVVKEIRIQLETNDVLHFLPLCDLFPTLRHLTTFNVSNYFLSLDVGSWKRREPHHWNLVFKVSPGMLAICMYMVIIWLKLSWVKHSPTGLCAPQGDQLFRITTQFSSAVLRWQMFTIVQYVWLNKSN